MFSYNAGNMPELKTTRMFRPVHQVAAPGRKSAFSDCILLLIGIIAGLFYSFPFSLNLVCNRSVFDSDGGD